MPWLRVVWKLGKLRLLRSHDGSLFFQWDGGHMYQVPRLPRLRRRHRRRAG